MSDTTIEAVKNENSELKEIIRHLEAQLSALYKERDENTSAELTTEYQTELNSNNEEEN
jgi:hypothetical protein